MRGTTAIAVATIAGLPLVACGQSEPTVKAVEWKMERTPDHRSYTLSGSATYLLTGKGGWYSAMVTLTDANGCRTEVSLQDKQDVDRNAKGWSTVEFGKKVTPKRQVALADFAITYSEAPLGSMDPRSVSTTGLYSESRVLGAKLNPPDVPQRPCGKQKSAAERTEKLRRKAMTDAEGADAEAIDAMGREEVLATAINTAGYLCARVTSAYPRGNGVLVVNCIEYRGGRGKVRYRVDAGAGTVEPQQ